MSEDITRELRGTNELKRGFSKKTALIIVVLLLLLIIPSGFYLFYQSEARLPLNATVENLKGSVLIQEEGKGDAVPAEIGMSLNVKDRIITGPDGVAEILFEDSGITRIASETRMDIKELYKLEDGSSKTVVLNVSSGSIWNSVFENMPQNQRFEVNTPVSLAGVKGTNFFVRVEQNRDTLIRVYEGIVGVVEGPGDNKREVNVSGKDFNGLLINPMEQAGFSPGIPFPNNTESLDVLDVDDFEKDNLVEDKPIIYIEVEIDVKNKLLEKYETRKNEIDEEINKSEREIIFLEESIDNEDKTSEIKKIVTNKKDEIEYNLLIAGLLEEEITELQDMIIILEEMQEKIEKELKEFNIADVEEMLRDEIRDIRRVDKAKADESGLRFSKITEAEDIINDILAEVVALQEDLGISAELQTIRDDEELPITDEEEEKEETKTTEKSSSAESRRRVTPVSQMVRIEYTVVLKPSDENFGTVTGAGKFISGSNVTVRAIPDEGYHFVNWTSGESEVSKNASFSFKVDKNYSLTANFKINSYDLTYKSGSNGTIKGDKSQKVTHGDSGTVVEAVPDKGYLFVGWSDGVKTAKRTDKNVKKSIQVTANFALPGYAVYEVIIGVSPEGAGSVAGDGTYKGGSSATIKAVANEGHSFVDWTENGQFISGDKEYTFKVNANRYLTANFTTASFVLKYTAGDNGSILGEASQNVVFGGSGTEVEAVADEGYHFVGWSDDVDTAKRIDEDVTEGIDVIASFAKKEYTLEYIAGENGDLIGTKLQKVLHDEDGTMVTAVPEEGYRFVVWSDGLETITRTDLNVKDDLSVTAIFQIKTYIVTFVEWEEKFIESVEVSHGSDAIPPEAPVKADYLFTGWDKDLSNVTEDFTAEAIYIDFVPDGDSSGITNQEKLIKGSKEVRLTIAVLNTEGLGDGGYEAEDFSVSIDGNAPVTFADEAFYGFTDNFDGTYTVIFVGAEHETVYSFTDLYIRGILIESGPTEVETPSDGVMFIVVFEDYDGIELGVDIVENGEAATAPDDLQREGYTFVGWDTDFSTITQDLTVVAQYEEIIVQIPDDNLREIILEALEKNVEDIIKPEDMEMLNGYLDVIGKDIADLTGLEYAINIIGLGLDDNNITDLGPLQNLENLTDLYLSNNEIEDISPLEGLLGLELLELNNNKIEDIASLQEMVNLVYIDITNNYLDLSPESDSMAIINTLLDSDVGVIYEPQKIKGGAVSIQSSVYDELTGIPVEDALVYLYWDYIDDGFNSLEMLTLTDTAGSFEFSDLPAGSLNCYDLFVYYEGYFDKWVDGELFGAGDFNLNEVNIIPEFYSTVSGIVTDKEGEPLEGVLVEAEWLYGFSSEESPKVTLTDHEGSYSLTIPAGTHLLHFNQAYYENVSEIIELYESDFVGFDVELDKRKLFTLNGNVTDQNNGDIIADVEIILYWEYEDINVRNKTVSMENTTKTDEDGNFEFTDLPLGYWNSYKLIFSHFLFEEEIVNSDFIGVLQSETLNIDLAVLSEQ